MEDTIFIVVVAARLLIPLLIPRFPLPAIITALVIDAVDQTVLAAFDAEPDNYQQFDKALDVYYLSIAYLSTFRNWPERFAFRLSQFLWYYRLIGVLAFELTEVRVLLMIFPNTFEFFFIFYELVRVSRDPERLPRKVLAGVAAGIWIIIKLPQEFFIHVAQLDATTVLREQPVVLVIVIGALIGGALYLNHWRKTWPPASWEPSFRVDAHPTTVLTQPAVAPTGRWVLLDHPLIEKTLLVGLLITIFVQLIDDNGASAPKIILGVAFIIAATTATEYLLAGRFQSWRQASTSFLCTGIITTSIVVILGLLPVRSIDDDTGILFTWFLLALLTLVITRYDRYRNLRIASFLKPRSAAHGSIRSS